MIRPGIVWPGPKHAFPHMGVPFLQVPAAMIIVNWGLNRGSPLLGVSTLNPKP